MDPQIVLAGAHSTCLPPGERCARTVRVLSFVIETMAPTGRQVDALADALDEIHERDAGQVPRALVPMLLSQVDGAV